MERTSPSKSSKFEIPVLVLAMVFPSLLTWVYFVLLAGTPAASQQIAYGLGKTFQFALPVLWIGAVCREAWRVRRMNLRGLVEGTLFGVAVFMAMVILYSYWLTLPGGVLAYGSDAYWAIVKKIQGIGFLDMRLFLLLGLFYSVIHSGLEEYYWRWFVFGKLRKHTHWLAAAVVSSLGFMAHHVILLGTYFGYDSPYCWLGSVSVAVGGFYWAWLYKRSDSIWGPWIGHGFIDAAIFWIGFLMIIRETGWDSLLERIPH